jgi:trans-aconitate methyltransferase
VDRYQKQHSFVYQYGASLVELAQPQPGERILDLGCGTGELTNALAAQQQAASAADLFVTGMDADPAMIVKARDQYPHLTFVQGDVRNFQVDKIGDGSSGFDLVFSNAALHWIPPVDAERAVECISRALQPSGRLVVEFGGKGNVQKIIRATQQVLMLPETFNPWYYPSISEFTSLLERHGIEVTTALLFDRPTLLQDGEAGLSNWLRMFGSAFFQHLSSAEEIESALQQISEVLLPELFDGEQWTADYRRIRVVGRKIK